MFDMVELNEQVRLELEEIVVGWGVASGHRVTEEQARELVAVMLHRFESHWTRVIEDPEGRELVVQMAADLSDDVVLDPSFDPKVQ